MLDFEKFSKIVESITVEDAIIPVRVHVSSYIFKSVYGDVPTTTGRVTHYCLSVPVVLSYTGPDEYFSIEFLSPGGKSVFRGGFIDKSKSCECGTKAVVGQNHSYWCPSFGSNV